MKTYKFVSVEIKQDDSPCNPRDEFDNLSTFYGPRNGHYGIGGKDDVELESWNLSAHMQEFKREGAVIVPFQSNAGECFAVITREDVKKEYGNDSRSSLYRARQCAKGEIEEFLAWASGEVYGYEISDKETGEILDSCWGFYGVAFCEQEAQSQADYFESEAREAEARIESRLSNVTA